MERQNLPQPALVTATGYPLNRENSENGQKKNPRRGKHREFGNFAENTGNLVYSSCKFPDSKGKRYF